MNNKPRTLNDKAWKKIFDKYRILESINRDGLYLITSKQINEFREARLMTKFDHKSNLPILFQENELSILPITRGSYVISNFEAYHKFERVLPDINKVAIPDFIHSIDFENITSEAVMINVIYLSGILRDFVEEESIYPTIDGRMSSGEFYFNILNNVDNTLHEITVMNSQIEIDGGYEGFDSLTIIEAKNSISEDFLIRQLYYPFRLFAANKIRKPIKPVFITYTNGVFGLYEYEFQDIYNYNSIKLKKHKSYTFEHDDVQLEEILSIFENISITSEPIDIPFPQADSFERVINLCEILYENQVLTIEQITYNYDFDVRQTRYYTDAGRYLGLIERIHDNIEGVLFSLTKKGRDLFALNIKNRNLSFVKFILEKRAFNEAFKKYLAQAYPPSINGIVKIMERSRLYNVTAPSTYRRRASTISSWINWVMSLAA